MSDRKQVTEETKAEEAGAPEVRPTNTPDDRDRGAPEIALTQSDSRGPEAQTASPAA